MVFEKRMTVKDLIEQMRQELQEEKALEGGVSKTKPKKATKTAKKASKAKKAKPAKKKKKK